ncbi:helix-turn-helix domain-containing protein [Pontibacter harenae]|uniref:helix-turn-helix domain-containing protein n=1 Tax=Pontibacter harenae TaxID=2894083 RepID=UPI001E30E983|nr:helix-turn-helix domain-containing protein [Pontibacter harenae]MCC9167599.1 helix-turn-helix domain-containing protein [Pontibacter harenae]
MQHNLSNIALTLLTVPDIRNIFREELSAYFGSNYVPYIQSETDQLLNVDEAAAFLGLKKETLYGKVRRREIPVNKQGNRLYFSKTELTEWVKGGRKLTTQELDVKASTFRRYKK